MIKKYIITYTRGVAKLQYTTEMDAPSKYAAKKRFYQLYPRYDIVHVKEKGEA